MKIEIKLNSTELKASQIEGEQANKIIEGFFKTLMPKEEIIERTTVAAPVKPVVKKEPIKQVAKAVEEPKSVQQIARPKTLPMVESNKTMTHNPFEKLLNRDEFIAHVEQGDVRTGTDGKKLYKSEYHCPECGHSGKRFIREENTYLKCHNCSTKLLVEEAVPGEFLAQDREGYFFIARDYFEGDK